MSKVAPKVPEELLALSRRAFGPLPERAEKEPTIVSPMPGLRLLSDRLSGSGQSRSIATYTSFFGIGTALSLATAGFIASSAGWRTAFVASALGPLVAGAAVFLLLAAIPPRGTASSLSLFPIAAWRAVLRDRARRFAPAVQDFREGGRPHAGRRDLLDRNLPSHVPLGRQHVLFDEAGQVREQNLPQPPQQLPFALALKLRKMPVRLEHRLLHDVRRTHPRLQPPLHLRPAIRRDLYGTGWPLVSVLRSA